MRGAICSTMFVISTNDKPFITNDRNIATNNTNITKNDTSTGPKTPHGLL